MVTAKPWGTASVLSLVFQCESKYTKLLGALLRLVQMLPGTLVSTEIVPLSDLVALQSPP